MLVYQETSKTKSGELRITRPIGALMIKCDVGFANLNNEKISIFLERAGTSVDIAVNVPLKDFIALTTFGTSSVFEDDSLNITAICEIAHFGALHLGVNESIKVVLTDLNSNKTYQINGIEYPVITNLIAKFDRRTLLSDETSRNFKVLNADAVAIKGFSAVTEIHLVYSNGTTVKHTAEEFRALALDTDPIQNIKNGVVEIASADYVVFPLVGINAIDVYKNTGTVVTLTTLDENDLYN